MAIAMIGLMIGLMRDAGMPYVLPSALPCGCGLLCGPRQLFGLLGVAGGANTLSLGLLT